MRSRSVEIKKPQRVSTMSGAKVPIASADQEAGGVLKHFPMTLSRFGFFFMKLQKIKNGAQNMEKPW